MRCPCAKARRPCKTSPAGPNIWALNWALCMCSTLGAASYSIIPMFTASCPPADCARMACGGCVRPPRTFSCRKPFWPTGFASGSKSGWPMNTRQNWRHPPGCLAAELGGRPFLATPLMNRLHDSAAGAQSNYPLRGRGAVLPPIGKRGSFALPAPLSDWKMAERAWPAWPETVPSGLAAPGQNRPPQNHLQKQIAKGTAAEKLTGMVQPTIALTLRPLFPPPPPLRSMLSFFRVSRTRTPIWVALCPLLVHVFVNGVCRHRIHLRC